MQTQNTQISCPQCDHQIDVNNVLRQKLDSDLRKEYEQKLNEERNNLKSQQNGKVPARTADSTSHC